MSVTPENGRSRRLAVVAAAVLTVAAAAIAAQAALPSTVSSRVKTINMALDQVEKGLEADRLATAQRKLQEAQRYLKEIQDRYGGKFDASEPDYKAMTDRLAALAAKVDAAEKASAGAAAADKEAKAANEALCSQWIEKLGPFLDYKSDQYLRIGSDLNTASPENQAKSRAAYARAKALVEEYQKVQFPLGKSQELANVESRLSSAMQYYGRDEADAAQEAACKEWVDRLAPYVDTGSGSRKLLIASPTADAQQLKTQQALYEEATKTFADYQKAGFPKGKTSRLQGLEENLRKVLDAMPQAFARSQAMMSGDVGRRLDAVLEYLDRDPGWKDDPSKKPPTIMARDLAPLRDEVQRYGGTVKADDPKLADLKAKLKAIETKDAEHRVIWAKRTFQRPDGYAGPDLEALKAKAKAVAQAAHPKADVLRVTVPGKDWAIEDVIEATDTTNTALRRRITRSLRAQAAVRDADGAVWLQEVWLGQDKAPDGSWGELKGHTTWADRMAPENLGKTGP